MFLKMIKNTVVAGCIGLVGLFSVSANAATDLGSLGVSGSIADGNFIGGQGTSFTDEYTFRVHQDVSAASLVTITWDSPFTEFSSFTPTLFASLYDGGDQPALSPFTSGNETIFSITAPIDQTQGIYKLNISGVTSGIAGGTYSFNISAVPLPAAAWLFISGFLAIGGMSYFKRKRAEKESFPSGALTA